jgi:hypothetical protein
MLRVLHIPRVHTTPRLTGCSGFNTLRWPLEQLGREGRANTTIYIGKGLDSTGCGTAECRVRYMEASRTWEQWVKCDTLETDDRLLDMLHKKKLEADIICTDFQFMAPYHSVIQYEAPFAMSIPEVVPIATIYQEFLSYGQLAYMQHPVAKPLLFLSALCGGFLNVIPYQKTEFAKLAGPLVPPALLRELVNSEIILPCLDTEYTDFEALARRNEKRRLDNPDKPKLVFQAGSPLPVRRWEVAADAIEKCRVLGKAVNLRLATQLKKLPNRLVRPWIEAREGVSRPDLLEMLVDADITFEGTHHETTACFLHESILAGSLPLFLFDNKGVPWMMDRMPEDYPFVVHNEKDVAGRLSWILDNWQSDTVNTARSSMRAIARANVDQKKAADTTARLFGKIIQRRCNPAFARSMYVEVFRAALDKFTSPVTRAQLGEMCASVSRNGELNPAKILSRPAFRRQAQVSGWMDVGTPEEALWAPGWEEWVAEDIRKSNG